MSVSDEPSREDVSGPAKETFALRRTSRRKANLKNSLDDKALNIPLVQVCSRYLNVMKDELGSSSSNSSIKLGNETSRDRT